MSTFTKCFLLCVCLVVWQPASVCGQVMINEFLAVNSNGLVDEDGERSDWIELYNAGPFAVDLQGWHLTDDSNDLVKWTFPQVLLPSGAYLVVFASDKNRAPTNGQLHTNFKLTAGGEYLALVQSNATTIEWEYAPTFPDQSQNVSYGINLSSQLAEYYTTPTPGASNNAGLVDVLAPMTVSPARGFYDAAFQVTLASVDPGVTIRYTLDGSAPTAGSGSIYSGPIPISTTTVLRVLAYQTGYISQPVVTHTYIFPSHVLNQASSPPGYPSMWGSSVPAVYGMYPGHPDSNATLREGLLALPTVCVSGKIDDIFGPVNGFYFHGSKGNNDSWEKPGSLELIHPDGKKGFQVNAGVLGRADNVTAARKRGLRIEFKSIYGPSKLKFTGLFDGAKEGRATASDEFDALILRPGKAENYTAVSYNPHLNIYFRDIMVRDAQVAISGYGDRNIFVHLYLNGMYWGVYDLTEVYNQDYFADYFGGEPEDWFDVSTKDSSRRDGAAGLYDNTDVVATNRYLSFLSFMDTADLSQYSNYLRAAQDIKPKDFAEYIICNSYYGVGDWPDNNWNFAMRNGPNPEPGFFLVWDAEKTWFENNDPQSYKHARYSPYLQSLNNPEGADYHPVINRVWEGLIKNAEFRMLFADRSYELMHNDGLLTDSNRISRFMYYVDLLNLPIRIDQKRWGADDRRGTLPGVMFTYANVQTEINKVLANTVDNVSKYIAAFRAKQLYPSIDPPLIAVTVTNATATTCTLSGGSGTRVYYTTDGTDPRLIGGSVSPDAQTYAIGADNTLVGFGESDWKYYVTPNGLGDSSIAVGHGSYNTGNWKHPDYLDTPVAGAADNQWHQGAAPLGYGSVGASGNLTTFGTTIGYGPVSTNRYPTTYFRREFNVTNASSFASLRLDAIFEDGGIVYLNGREIARSSAPFNTGNMSYGTFSLRDQSGAAENTVETHTRILLPGDLVEGRNVIAVETHNFTANNSDLAMELKVTGLRPPNPGVNVQLTDNSLLKVRSWQAGEWSALNQLAVSRPSLRQIIFSEIMYNPPMSNGVDGDAFEFVELKNVGTAAINLRGMTFTRGLTFTFNADLVLAPGTVAVLVADAAQFAIKYPGVPIAGSYTGSLANDGETLELQDIAGVVVARTTYNDKSPWPGLADNGGYSLVPIGPTAVFDESDPTLWQASRNPGGSPGNDDPPPVVDVLINEILAHTDPPQKDSLELRNASSQPVDVSGWSLTDDRDVPAKFIIPAGTPRIASGGYLVFDEDDFNSTPGVPPSFALSSLGESIFLFAPEGAGWRLVHEVDFKASANGVSFGLHALSTGGIRHPAQISHSLGLTNFGPSVGPVVISEIMFHPLFPAGTEFIELRNISGAPVPLFDPANPSNTWRINGASFQFPINVTLDSDEFLLVVNTDPAQFRTDHGVPTAVKIFGPIGRLDDSGETLELQKPDAPQLDSSTGLAFAPYITVDEVSYRNASPWPTGTAGTGAALARISPLAFGDDPINWASAIPTPGTGASNVVDTDGDGIPDDVEMSYGLNPAKGADSSLDLDGDGWTNLEEWRSGTALNNPADLLRLSLRRPTSDRMQLFFDAKPGWRYQVQANQQLSASGWISIDEISPVRSGRVLVDQTLSAHPARFYRLAVLPPL